MNSSSEEPPTGANRRRFAVPRLVWPGALGAAVAGFAWLWIATAPPDPLPDIVFILVDTLRADHLELYGYGSETAENLSRLAADGVVYERVVSPSSWTKTSMASIWTSRNALRHGVLTKTSVLPGELTTLSASLRQAGYHTIGVNSNPWLREKYGFSAGFDDYVTLYRPPGFVDAGEITARAIELMELMPVDRPVFLYVHYMDVHPPYTWKADPPAIVRVTLPGLGAVADDVLEYDYRKKSLEGPGVQQRILDLYDAGIRATDAAIGDLLGRLDALDRSRTRRASGRGGRIVVVTSDHGEAFREHGTTEHGQNIYPEVYRVPLLLVAPGRLQPGTRIPGQMRSIDIAPTLLEIVGAGLPESFDGRPLPRSPANGRSDRTAISSVGFGGYAPGLHFVAVVSGTHLLIRERVSDVVEFYDLARDPGALHDLGVDHPDAARHVDIERSFAVRETGHEELGAETVEALRSLGYLQ